MKHNSVDGFDKFFVTNSFSIADSLVYPLLLAPIKKVDTYDILSDKYNLVNDFVDVYTNIRMLCNRPITQSSIRNYFYDLIKEIRNKEVDELRGIFSREVEKLQDITSSFRDFYVDNQGYYHYLFARILYSLDVINEEYNFNDLLRSRKQSSFILTPIFRMDEIENFTHEIEASNLDNLISNFVLIRRYDFDEFVNKQTRHKLLFLTKKGYLPELLGEDFLDKNVLEFLEYRSIHLNTIIHNIWV